MPSRRTFLAAIPALAALPYVPRPELTWDAQAFGRAALDLCPKAPFAAGDVFTIAGEYAVNPPTLEYFRVTEIVESDPDVGIVYNIEPSHA
jgi:hypothetical protein